MNKDQEMEELQQINHQTKRVTVPSLEEILYKELPVLDHGFIRLIDYMGDDSSIVQAARVSYGKGTKKVNEDKGLIAYLMRHRHTTPFEMCDIKLHVKLPIFVARQWIRHRTASVNEYSARYSILTKEFYIPQKEHMSAQSLNNRQGRDGVLPTEYAEEFINILQDDAERCYHNYEYMLNTSQNDEIINEGRPGLSRELARMNLNLNYYTEWYWKTNLHNLLHFIALRADSHAQYEIRAYADIIANIVEKWVPYTYESFNEYRVNGANFSAKALEVVKKMIAGQKVSQEESNMSKREWSELMEKLGNE